MNNFNLNIQEMQQTPSRLNTYPIVNLLKDKKKIIKEAREK